MRSRMSGVTAASFSGVAFMPAFSKKGKQLLAQLFHGQRANVLGVEPYGLGIEGVLLSEVDHGVGAVYAFKSEQFR